MRRLARSATVTAILLVMTATPAGAETLEQRIDRMERELRELRTELKRRDAAERRHAVEADKARAAAPVAVAPVPAPAPTAPAAPAPVVAADETRGGKEAALRGLLDRVQLGGYGSIRYEGSSLQEQKHTFTYRRFVLTADANIAPRLRTYMELEFERFRELELEKTTSQNPDGGLSVEQTVEGTNESEISFEQGWLQYDVDDWLKLRAGAVLVPLGRFNLNHDDNRWDIPRRSLVDRGVSVLPVPAAWDELGVGFLGDVPVGEQGQLSYQGYVVNGVSLDTEFEQVISTRKGDTTKHEIEAKVQPSTGTFGSDLKDAKAVTGRLAWSPRLGHEIAASGYFGQYTPDFLGNEDLWSVAADGRTGYGPFELEGEWVYTRFEGIRNVARALARTAIDQESEAETGDVETEVDFELAGLAHAKHGFWLEGRYRFWPTVLSDTFVGRAFDHPQMVAVLRGEQVWLDGLVQDAAFRNGHLTAFDDENRRVGRITAGLAYRPVPLVAFQLAYEFTMTDSGKSLAGVTNFLPAGPHEDHAHTVLVGAAFGF